MESGDSSSLGSATYCSRAGGKRLSRAVTEVSAADRAAHSDARELLKRQGSGVELLDQTAHVLRQSRAASVIIDELVIDRASVAESLVGERSKARVQLAPSVAECEQLRREVARELQQSRVRSDGRSRSCGRNGQPPRSFASTCGPRRANMTGRDAEV